VRETNRVRLVEGCQRLDEETGQGGHWQQSPATNTPVIPSDISFYQSFFLEPKLTSGWHYHKSNKITVNFSYHGTVADDIQQRPPFMDIIQVNLH